MKSLDTSLELALPLPLGLEGLGDEEVVGRGGLDGAALVRGPVGGARSGLGFELRDRAGFVDRGGVRVLAREVVCSFRGERERRDGTSSAALVSLLSS